MKKRQIIIIAVAIIILVLGKLGSDMLASSNDKPSPTTKDNTSTVFTTTVKNAEHAVFSDVTGLLEAVNRLEIYSEVQGVMLPDGGRFKAGTHFEKGQTLLALKADDVVAKLVSQRSTFERNLTALMADMRLDYPDEYPAWQTYMHGFNVEAALKDLPVVTSDKFKGFITGKNIYSEFYSIKNAEILLSKYRITAPYTGLLVQAEVDPGTVVRAGQKLGVFLKPGHYEMGAAVSLAVLDRVKEGQEVLITVDGNRSKSWKGKVSRINRSIDASSQLGEFFAEVYAEDLSEGMFVEAKVGTTAVSDAFEIPRSVLFDENQVFIIENGQLAQVTVDPVHVKEQTVLVKGLTDGSEILTKIPPGSFAGMNVRSYTENKAK